MERKRFAITVLFIALTGLSRVSGLTFDVSPRPDGSIAVDFSMDWQYGATPLFSGVHASYDTSMEQDETAASYVATVGRTLSAEADLIGWRAALGAFSLEAALNGKFDRMVFREIGYVDQNAVRYFVLNDRTIDLWLPRLTGKASATLGPLSVSASGEYSPWFQVNLDQALTISPGLAKTPYQSSQSGANAFSVTGTAALQVPMLAPQVEVVYDRVGIAYSAMTAAGAASIDSMIESLLVRISVCLRFIDIKGLSPTLVASFGKTTTTDRKSGAQYLEDGAWTFGFGLR